MDIAKIRDRDLIVSRDGIIFLAIGHFHQGKVTAGPKYISSALFPTQHAPSFSYENQNYLWRIPNAFTQFVLDNFPHYHHFDPNFYLDRGIGIAPEHIHRVLRPEERLAFILKEGPQNSIQQRAIDLALIAKNANIPKNKLGVTSSMLIGAEVEGHSDVDFVVYGAKNFKKITSALNKHPQFRRFTKKEWKEYFDKYKLAERFGLNFETFYQGSADKTDRGILNGTQISIFSVRTPAEVRKHEPLDYSKKLGSIEIKASVIDSSQASFIPSIYSISKTQILTNTDINPIDLKEIVSLNREWCAHARKGDIIHVQGILQECHKKGKIFPRILLGTPHSKKEFFVSLR
ncbi:MAG: hypothetical protein ABH803_04490 [Candidatus Micrarchaeota archaeon]